MTLEIPQPGQSATLNGKPVHVLTWDLSYGIHQKRTLTITLEVNDLTYEDLCPEILSRNPDGPRRLDVGHL